MSRDPLIETVAIAIAEGFWQTAERPKPWNRHSELEKEVWRLCAGNAIEAGKRFRLAQRSKELA